MGHQGMRRGKRGMVDIARQRSALFIAATALVGCGDVVLTEQCGSLATGDVRIATWWSRLLGSAEGNALGVLEQEFNECNPQANAVTVEFENKYTMFDVVPRSLEVDPQPEADAPPAQSASARYPIGSEPAVDVIHLNAGWDVLGFTPCGKDGPKKGLLPLNSVLDPETLARPLAWRLADDCEGSVYALPVGIHRLNTLYVNKAQLQRVGCDADDVRSASPDAFLSLLSDLDAVLVRGQAPSGETCVQQVATASGGASGVESVLAIGSGEDWALSMFAFENVMVSHLGAVAYKHFWEGWSPTDEAGLEDFEPLSQLLEALSAYAPYLQPDEPTPRQAFERVLSGRAIFTVVGYWYEKELTDSDVATVPFPGTEMVRIETADVFAIASNSPNPKGAAAWLRAVTTEHVQQPYIEEKGGTAARTDIAPLEAGMLYLPALPSYIPSEHFNHLGTKLSDWMQGVLTGSRNDQHFIRYVAEEYCSLDHAKCGLLHTKVPRAK